jgi:thiamine biosynthesis protein ThiS
MNGQERVFEKLAPGATILDLLAALELKTDRIALEVNGEIVSRSCWGDPRLLDGDKIELVHFVGGGQDI